MKTLLVLAVLIFFGATWHGGAEEPLTATELARHLHVFAWITKINLQGHPFTVEVVHVVDGKIKSTLLANGAFPTDRPFERIVVLANQTAQGTKVSIQPGASGAIAMGLTEPSETIPLAHTLGLPETASEGDYLLGEGEVWMNPSPREKHVQIKEIKEGLVLRLHPKAAIPAS